MYPTLIIIQQKMSNCLNKMAMYILSFCRNKTVKSGSPTTMLEFLSLNQFSSESLQSSYF